MSLLGTGLGTKLGGLLFLTFSLKRSELPDGCILKGVCLWLSARVFLNVYGGYQQYNSF